MTAIMPIPDAEALRVKSAAAAMGRKGGSVKSAKKARTPDHYRRIGKKGAAVRIKNLRKKQHGKAAD